jgi:hypothetical protein
MTQDSVAATGDPTLIHPPCSSLHHTVPSGNQCRRQLSRVPWTEMIVYRSLRTKPVNSYRTDIRSITDYARKQADPKDGIVPPPSYTLRSLLGVTSPPQKSPDPSHIEKDPSDRPTIAARVGSAKL